jgi:hypothetical protein
MTKPGCEDRRDDEVTLSAGAIKVRWDLTFGVSDWGNALMTLREFRILVLMSCMAAATISTAVVAQDAPSVNYTSFDATPAAPVQLGYYGAFHKDCSPAPLPTIRVSEAPKSGTLTIRPGQLTTSSTAQCPGAKIPALVASYQARSGARGTDHLVYEVVEASHVAAYDVTITIKEAPKSAAPNSDKPI